MEYGLLEKALTLEPRIYRGKPHSVTCKCAMARGQLLASLNLFIHWENKGHGTYPEVLSGELSDKCMKSTLHRAWAQ